MLQCRLIEKRLTMKACLKAMICVCAMLGLNMVQVCAEEMPATTAVGSTGSDDSVKEVKEVDEGTVLARVNGEAITLRALEDDLMRQEGTQTIEKLLRMQLAKVDWSAYKDDDMIVKIADIEVPRILLISQLIEQQGADVREQMIQGLIVKQALHEDGLVLDDQLKQDMLEHMKRKHRLDQKAKGTGTVVPFATAIQEKYGKSIEEWTNDPAFLTLAGLYALLYKRTPIAEAALHAYFNEHVIRYAKPEAYKLSVLPFHLLDKDGKPVAEDERQTISTLASNTYELIKSKKRSFAAVVRLYDAEFLGDRGFVDRNGNTEAEGVQRVPAAVMTEVFRHHYDNFPTVLGNLESPDAISIVEVRAYRQAEKPDFAAVQHLVKQDMIDADFDTYMGSFLRDLKAQSKIDYSGMMPVIQARRQDLRSYLLKRQQELKAAAKHAAAKTTTEDKASR